MFPYKCSAKVKVQWKVISMHYKTRTVTKKKDYSTTHVTVIKLVP